MRYSTAKIDLSIMSTFCTNIDLSALEYKPPAANRNGGKVVHVSTKKGSKEYEHRLRFQMSEDQNQNLQNAVWGLSTPLAGQDGNRRTLELTIESPDLEGWLNKLDDQNIETAVKSSQDWFKKGLDIDAIKNMYVYMVKPPSKDGSKSTVRVKVKTGDVYPTNIFIVQSSENGSLSYTRGTSDDLTKNCKCMVMCECVGLWFMSRQFGMSLNATDILVWPTKRTTGIDAFTFTNNMQVHKVETPPVLAPCDEVEMTDDM